LPICCCAKAIIVRWGAEASGIGRAGIIERVLPSG
jgi:hypothetical protein